MYNVSASECMCRGWLYCLCLVGVCDTCVSTEERIYVSTWFVRYCVPTWYICTVCVVNVKYVCNFVHVCALVGGV